MRISLVIITFFVSYVNGRGGRYSFLSQWNHSEVPTGAIFNIDESPNDAYQNSYFASYDKFLYSLDVNGKKRWAFSLSSTGSSTPALKADGTAVYVFTEDGNAYALSTDDGSQLWTRKLCAPIYSSPVVGTDGVIYVSLFLQGAPKSCGTSFLYALNPDGSVKWNAKDTYSYGAIASPTLSIDGTSVFVIWYLGVLLSFQTSNGAMNPNHMFPNTGRSLGYKCAASPTVNPHTGDVYYMDFNGDFYAVKSNASTGSLSWKWTLSKLALMPSTDITSSAAVSTDGTIVYVGSLTGSTSNPSLTFGTMYAISASNGAKLWSYKTTGGGILSSPIVDVNGNVFFGSDDNNIYALTPQVPIPPPPLPLPFPS